MDGNFAHLMSEPWLGATICAAAAVLAAFACYAVTRKLFGRNLAEDSELLARTMIARLGTLHALILALIFAHEMFDYLEITKAVNREVSAISDVYYGLDEYDRENPQFAANIRGALTDYVEAVLRDERVALTEDRLSDRTWADYRRVGRALRALEPSTEDQSEMRKEMLAD